MAADSQSKLIAALSGSQRAAVLLLSLGEDEAGQVLRHLSVRDVQSVGGAMAALKSVTRDQADAVLDSFSQVIEQQSTIGVAAEDYIRKMLINALGEEKASSLIERILQGRTSKGMEALKWMDSRAVAEMIGMEHPQIQSIILAHLEPDQAAEVIGFLPQRVRSDVIMRIASLDGIQPHALHELDAVIAQQFSGNNKFQSSSIGGYKAAANILNAMETSVEAALMETITKSDENLSQKLQELMFVFDDLSRLDDRSLQTLLREVASDRLVIALKGADTLLRDKIFANMSKRAAEMLRDDLEVKGPVKLSEVDAAQKEILLIARRLGDSGQISLGGGGEEYV
ncbi:MAG: flagellar motor switch protein FliG [Lysobacterales bacterium CG17_big_fil_post_rev_8_21_14_2_50_64_11]|nr:MAG: flagellar motor switch protein FliG [Xanthomonadales bacterium CG17_big_fil_post_rev_8_21_14_2_50_64_11]PIX59431.1 MAG: flagellar motor switch protein FliG [Xanthomonadales bacterium CG_4_10_14_3_um_filter_64_11]